MFKSVKEQDSYKNTQTHYYLTQGDSCTITATPYKNGELTPVDGCKFKLATSDYKSVFEKDMVSGENNSWILTLSSDESALLNAGSYIYEIEYSIGNDYYTPHSWKFDIIKQITK